MRGADVLVFLSCKLGLLAKCSCIRNAGRCIAGLRAAVRCLSNINT